MTKNKLTFREKRYLYLWIKDQIDSGYFFGSAARISVMKSCEMAKTVHYDVRHYWAEAYYNRNPELINSIRTELIVHLVYINGLKSINVEPDSTHDSIKTCNRLMRDLEMITLMEIIKALRL